MNREEQEILKAFDRRETPFLTAAELSEEIGTSQQETTRHLKQMQSKGLVGSKRTTTGVVSWWAQVAPELADEARQHADNATQNNSVSLSEIDERIADHFTHVRALLDERLSDE